MLEEIKEYIRKVLELGAKIEKNDSLVIYMPEEIPELERVILELKEEYQIADIRFIKRNYEKIYRLLASNPTDEEIYNTIEQHQPIKTNGRIKILYCIQTVENNPYYQRLINEYGNRFIKYNRIFAEKNRQLATQIDSSPIVSVICPNASWAKLLFNDETATDRLWNLVTRMIPPKDQAKAIIKELQERTARLNELRLKTLNFQADNGTDLNVTLSPASRWINCFQDANVVAPNYPSYEIYSSPAKYETEGLAVMSSPSFFRGFGPCQAKLEFKNGRIIRCETDNDHWGRSIMIPWNNLNYLGEVALVSSDTPIAKLGNNFFVTQADENAGCHIALGNRIEGCIDYLDVNWDPDDFNSSNHHFDLPIGRESMCVTATGSYKGKTLVKIPIIENGKWQI